MQLWADCFGIRVYKECVQNRFYCDSKLAQRFSIAGLLWLAVFPPYCNGESCKAYAFLLISVSDVHFVQLLSLHV